MNNGVDKYENLIREKSKEIIDNKDYDHLLRILINYDTLVKQMNRYSFPDKPFWLI